MKVQLRRWFAIGLTSGTLAVSMLAGSGAVGAAATGNAAAGSTNAADSPTLDDNIKQRDNYADLIAPTDRVVTLAPPHVATIVSFNVAPTYMSGNYLDNR